MEEDNSILEESDFTNSDIDIKPELYIHNTLLAITEAMKNPDLRSGILQLRLLVEYLESLARASNRLPETYETELKEAETSLPENLSEVALEGKLILIKQRLLLKYIFSTTKSDIPLKM